MSKHLFGVPEQVRSIQGIESGAKYKIRFRPREYASVVLKLASGVERRAIALDGEGRWSIGLRMGRNLGCQNSWIINKSVRLSAFHFISDISALFATIFSKIRNPC